MPTPPKPFSVLTTEKKSHRTKAELKQREEGEKALATGKALKERPEVKNNAIAHKEFKRLSSLLKTIGKNDAIYEGVINRYCLMVAECNEFEELKSRLHSELSELGRKHYEGEIAFTEYLEYKDRLQNKLISCDKQLQSKRKMLLDIEKENIMTIAAALRSIPKKEEKSSNKLLEVLKDG
jgi:phage terminase small subunit